MLTGCTNKRKFNETTAGFADEIGYNDAPNDEIASNDTIYFGFDESSLGDQYIEKASLHAEYLLKHPNAHIRVDGHTDERGSRHYNLALGWKRAKTISDTLKQYGVSSTQITTMSYGKEKPLENGHNEAAHTKNRRAQIVYENQGN